MSENKKEHSEFPSSMGWRERLYTIVFDTNTPAGRLFDVVLLWIILLSVMGVMLESVKEIKQAYEEYFFYSEWMFTILFTTEYLIRLIISPRTAKYAFSFFGIIDFIALLPTYLTLLIPGGSYLIVIRSIRLLRAFRVLKLGRYLKEATVLSDALVASRYKILVFLGAVTTLVMIAGTLMYMIEGSQGEFTSIPRSIYWAIVTVTTVGYGDIAPQTVIGQITASILMLMGYAIIAVPTGIVSSEITHAEHKEKSAKPRLCSGCGREDVDPKAKFCSACGTRLD